MTMIELLVVVAITGLLMGILLPTMSRARGQARAVICKTNLKSLISGVLTYATANHDVVVPSYNMHGVSGNRSNPLDGWGPILDQNDYVMGNAALSNNPFVCPETKDVAGLAATNRGGNADQPLGYMDWPAAITFTGVLATTIPHRGYDKIVRVSYWINGENPIGAPRALQPGIHFTGSVGYGPDPSGLYLQPNHLDDLRTPERLIALADGIFSGNQYATRPGQNGLRIGYRHRAGDRAANVAFADGHVEPIGGGRFPRKMDVGLNVGDIRAENLGGGPTIYAYPEKFLAGRP